MTKVHVIGAGFSGLTLAYFLQREGFTVEIFERRPVVGGLISTRKSEHGLIETAANAFMNTALLEEVAEDLGVPLVAARSEARKRYILRDGKPRRWPLGAAASLRLARVLFSTLARRTLPPPEKGESVKAWGERVLGPETTEYLLLPALQGVYAGDGARLSASLILAPFVHPTKSTVRPRVRGSVAPRDGMGSWIAALESKLRERGVRIHLSVDRAPEVPDAITVYCGSAADAPDWKSRVETLPLVSATLFFAPDPALRPGFGVLFPASEKFSSLGVLYNHCIFPDRSTGISETWISGGAHGSEVLRLSDAEMVERILRDRARLHGLLESPRPLDFSVTRWENAIPHYTVELESELERSDWRPRGRGPHYFGNYQGALGLTKILARAKAFASELARNGESS